jgi:hypothetical protein
MKRILYSLVLLLSTSSLFATIRTVSNNPSTIAQFNTIQAAITAATSGDTIYVHGSPNAYGTFTVDKRLIILGPGWSPAKSIPLTAFINSGVIITGSASAGTEFQGLHFLTTVTVQTLGVNNIRFVRNRFTNLSINIFPNAAGTVSGYLFEGNYFENANVQTNTSYTMENFIFQNNLFYENGCCIGSNILGFTNSVNILFDHNLFYGPGSGTRTVFAGNTRFITLSNNIFVRRNASTDLSHSTFNNNITFNAGNDAPWSVNNNVDGGGNIAGQDPGMADQASVNSGVNNPLLNFTIAAGPANNAGTDGKDLGLLFDAAGSLNWSNSRGSRIPFIFSMNITTPTVAPGGNVSVTVEARRNN